MSEAARSRRDDARYEPQVVVPGRDPDPRDAGSPDPLAELARLVGQDDPFRNVFRPAVAPVAHAAPEADHAPRYLRDVPYPVAPEHYADHAADAHHGYDDAHAYADEHYPSEAGHDPYLAHDDQYAATERAAHPDEAGFADERLAPGYAADAALPDMWAQGEGSIVPGIDRGPAPSGLGGSGQSAARRPVAVLAAVLLLTGGGLAATYLAKGQSSSATVANAGRGAPTIMAATGPTKVKVDDGSATAPEDQDAALLNKNGNVSSGPVKIVSSQEQPADLGQLPKSDLADGARPMPQPSASPFPEPKKVKTFLVHPDGTMLSGDPAPAANPSSRGPAAGTALIGDAAATPRGTATGATTPRAAAPPATIASLTADAPPTDTAAAPPVKPGRQAASPGVGSGYGVQLASSPVEADANAAFAKLKKKYPTQLGSYTATVHKAETGDKPVYRVRIGGMGQDEAKALCSQLQSAGGSCLVMHN